MDSYIKAVDREKESQTDQAKGTKPLVLVGLVALGSLLANPIITWAVKFATQTFGVGPESFSE